MAALLELSNVQKAYGLHEVLDSLNFKVQRGEFIAIVGKSGCGKSTLLRLIAGLEKTTDGHVQMNGKPVSKQMDQIKIMFQPNSCRVFPGSNLAILHQRPLKTFTSL